MSNYIGFNRLYTFSHDSTVTGIAIFGGRIYTTTADGFLISTDLDGGNLQNRSLLGQTARGLDVNPNGTEMAVAMFDGDQSVHILNQSGDLVRKIQPDGLTWNPLRVAYFDEGTKLVVYTRGTAWIVDSLTGELISEPDIVSYGYHNAVDDDRGYVYLEYGVGHPQTADKYHMEANGSLTFLGNLTNLCSTILQMQVDHFGSVLICCSCNGK